MQIKSHLNFIMGSPASSDQMAAEKAMWRMLSAGFWERQSAKQLRGGNMQDVIFSGTENRKPLGFASVAITLDNSDHKLDIDFEEVTVTRKTVSIRRKRISAQWMRLSSKGYQ